MQAWKAFAAQQNHGGDEQWQGEQAGPPTGVSVFAADNTIRALMDPAGKILHWTEHNSGGHFAAMEVPDLLTADIRAFFGPLR